MAISIVFFVLAFPTYFFLQAANADSSSSLTAVNEYEIDGEYTYIELAMGDEFIPNGDPLMIDDLHTCLLYTSPSPRDATLSRMPSSA